MFKKGLAVAVILLFIGVAFTPSINAKDEEINDDTSEPLDIGRFMFRGFGLFPRYSGENVTFFALRLSYMMINSTERIIGVCWLKRITLPRSTIVHVGPFNIVIYVWGAFRGNPFEPPDRQYRPSPPGLEAQQVGP